MNSRGRFLATMHFEPAHPRPLWEWHYLQETVNRWHQEGLPQDVYLPPFVFGSTPEQMDAPDSQAGAGTPIGRYFGLDRGQPYCPGEIAYVPVDTGLVPAFEEQVLEEGVKTRIIVDGDGIKQEILKDVEPAMPRFLEFPVKSRQDFERLQIRYDATSPARYPAAWDAYKTAVRERDYPLGLMFDGFFGRMRKWMGLENQLFTLYDDPGLFGEMCDFHTEFILETIGRAVEEVDIDYVNIWEDMAYKTGPLMSPAHVRKYMLPGYRKIVDLLRGHGIDIIFVDCDGNLDLLIPIWLEAGINGVWPIEVAAGMDPVALQKQYGRDLLLVGGIDKRELSKGKPEVHAEVMRRVPALNEIGGYIPTVDHSVPPDVPLENYAYLRQLLAELA